MDEEEESSWPGHGVAAELLQPYGSTPANAEHPLILGKYSCSTVMPCGELCASQKLCAHCVQSPPCTEEPHCQGDLCTCRRGHLICPTELKIWLALHKDGDGSLCRHPTCPCLCTPAGMHIGIWPQLLNLVIYIALWVCKSMEVPDNRHVYHADIKEERKGLACVKHFVKIMKKKCVDWKWALWFVSTRKESG